MSGLESAPPVSGGGAPIQPPKTRTSAIVRMRFFMAPHKAIGGPPAGARHLRRITAVAARQSEDRPHGWWVRPQPSRAYPSQPQIIANRFNSKSN
jgi:hypothetical protein